MIHSADLNGYADCSTLRVGVVADTHIPDRARELHPALLGRLASEKVDLILHAGDICAPAVLVELEQIAPVLAVRGNRDWVFHGKLPLVQNLLLCGTRLSLLHGHGGFWPYWRDKWHYLREGYQIERYWQLVVRLAPAADVYVFGHTHRIVNEQRNGVLLFNPGSAHRAEPKGGQPSIGLLIFQSALPVESRIIYLDAPQENFGQTIKIRP